MTDGWFAFVACTTRTTLVCCSLGRCRLSVVRCRRGARRTSATLLTAANAGPRVDLAQRRLRSPGPHHRRSPPVVGVAGLWPRMNGSDVCVCVDTCESCHTWQTGTFPGSEGIWTCLTSSRMRHNHPGSSRNKFTWIDGCCLASFTSHNSSQTIIPSFGLLISKIN